MSVQGHKINTESVKFPGQLLPLTSTEFVAGAQNDVFNLLDAIGPRFGGHTIQLTIHNDGSLIVRDPQILQGADIREFDKQDEVKKCCLKIVEFIRSSRSPLPPRRDLGAPLPAPAPAASAQQSDAEKRIPVLEQRLTEYQHKSDEDSAAWMAERTKLTQRVEEARKESQSLRAELDSMQQAYSEQNAELQQAKKTQATDKQNTEELLVTSKALGEQYESAFNEAQNANALANRKVEQLTAQVTELADQAKRAEQETHRLQRQLEEHQQKSSEAEAQAAAEKVRLAEQTQRTQAESEALRAQLEAAQKTHAEQIAALQVEKDGVARRTADISKQVQQLQAALAASEAARAELQRKIDQKDTELANSQKQNALAKKQIEKLSQISVREKAASERAAKLASENAQLTQAVNEKTEQNKKLHEVNIAISAAKASETEALKSALAESSKALETQSKAIDAQQRALLAQRAALKRLEADLEALRAERERLPQPVTQAPVQKTMKEWNPLMSRIPVYHPSSSSPVGHGAGAPPAAAPIPTARGDAHEVKLSAEAIENRETLLAKIKHTSSAVKEKKRAFIDAYGKYLPEQQRAHFGKHVDNLIDDGLLKGNLGIIKEELDILLEVPHVGAGSRESRLDQIEKELKKSKSRVPADFVAFKTLLQTVKTESEELRARRSQRAAAKA